MKEAKKAIKRYIRALEAFTNPKYPDSVVTFADIVPINISKKQIRQDIVRRRIAWRRMQRTPGAVNIWESISSLDVTNENLLKHLDYLIEDIRRGD